MREPPESDLDADGLRAMGIDHPLIPDDDELVETVSFLQDMGVELDEMIGRDLSLLPGPRIMRPDAQPHPTALMDYDDEFTKHVILALGFHYDADHLGLTPAEASALRFFTDLRSFLPEDDVLTVVRSVGTATARISRSITSTLRLNYETPILEESGSIVEVARAYEALIADLFPNFLQALDATVRRHLARLAGERVEWTVDSAHSATREFVVIGFVDLVGFTEFTERAESAVFIEALTLFEREVNEIVVSAGGALVKLIGDEAMFAAPGADAANRILDGLGGLSLGSSGLSAVRVGIAAGQAVAAGGDYYGMVVNTAARAVGIAEPATAVLTAEAAELLGGGFEAIGPRELRGIAEPIALFRRVLV